MGNAGTGLDVTNVQFFNFLGDSMIRTHRPSLAVAAVCTLLALGGLTNSTNTADATEPEDEYLTYEFYYKVKWGYFGEWMELYKKNHYPILKRLQEMGRIVRMEATYPIDHAGEADRWDIRFTIVYPNVQIAYEDFDRSVILEELYPDQETFKKEEQRRFELLIEHKDVPVSVDNLSDW